MSMPSNRFSQSVLPIPVLPGDHPQVITQHVDVVAQSTHGTAGSHVAAFPQDSTV
jgi:hypothetical protein